MLMSTAREVVEMGKSVSQSSAGIEESAVGRSFTEKPFPVVAPKQNQCTPPLYVQLEGRGDRERLV